MTPVGKFKHVLLFLLAFQSAFMLKGQTGDAFTGYKYSGNAPGPAVINEQGRLTILYSFNELSLEGLKNEFGEFYKIKIPGHIHSSATGKPEMPVWSRLISIPPGTEPRYFISEVKSARIIPASDRIRGIAFPKQVDLTKNQDRTRNGFVIDREAYNTRGIINSDTVSIESIGKIRGENIANVQITPARYNPFSNELEVITSMKIEIVFESPAKSESADELPARSALFSKTLDKGLLNYNPEDVLTGYTDQPVRMIILTDTTFRKFLEPYTLWKTRKGYRITTLYRGAQYAGVSFAELKDTLYKIYNTSTASDPPPDYLMIVGDVNKIPTADVTTNISDLYYGEYDGNGDYLPEMFIGRIPAADTTELKSVVNKMLKYEKFEFADTNSFYSRALVTAGNDPSYSTYMNGQVYYASSTYLGPLAEMQEHIFYYPQSAAAEDTIKKLINSGVGFINYSGHGVATGWMDPSIYVTDIAQFTNKNMYPFVISNACRTGQFSIASSFGNKLITSADKGAVGFIGCSNDSYWDEDYYWAVGTGPVKSEPQYAETGLGIYDRLFHTHGESPSDWYITMGQVNFAGNLSVSSSTSTRKKYYWETYHLLGDPSIMPFIGKPETFKTTLPDTLPNGITSLSLTIEPFSYIAISHFDTLWDASFASPTGAVMLNLPSATDDSCLVVITGQNRIPLIKTIYFGELTGEYINLKDFRINDPDGNGNNAADYSESVYLELTVSNLGLAAADQVYATISTDSGWLTIETDSVYIGNLPGKSEISLNTDLRLSIADYITDNSFASLILKIGDSDTVKYYTIDLNLHAPVLEILNCIVNDSIYGNNNHIPEPGEKVDLIFKISNTGSSDIAGTLSLASFPPGIIVQDPEAPTGVIAFGTEKLIPITVSLAPTLSKGSVLNFSSLLDCTPYLVNKDYSITVGRIRESFEYQSFEIFPWDNTHSRPWIITEDQAYDGEFSARSAFIPPENPFNFESKLNINVNVPYKDTLTFWWKVSSEKNYDFLYFYLNGKQLFKISGEIDWAEKEIVLEEGYNVLEWLYKTDGSVNNGSSCGWIDNIRFPVSSFNRVDLKTGSIITPQPGKSYTQEIITAEVINLGTDTVNSFNLAYRINEDFPVAENFVQQVVPGDTLVVAFETDVNLSGEGSYLISVYGYSNNDGYLLNDTTYLLVVNTDVPPVYDTEDMVSIMPNPFSDYLRIKTEVKTDEEITIDIYNNTGKLLWKENAYLVAGQNILTITPQNLPPGFYTLQIRGKNIRTNVRIIKTN